MSSRPGAGVTVESRVLLLDGAAIDCEVRRSARRRRTVSFGVESGRIWVLAPMAERWESIEALLEKRAAWLRQQLAQPAVSHVQFTDGALVPFAGRQLQLRVTRSEARRTRLPTIDGDVLSVAIPAVLDESAAAAMVEARVRTWLRAAAVPLLMSRVGQWVAATGLAPARVEVRSQRRRWGSCSSNRTIRLNWRLVLLPPSLADYVVVHELCHLAEPSHGPAFWARVAAILPGHRALRAELRQLEPTLPI